MSVGLFLDLDGVLTPKSVNLQFASMLGIEKDLVDIEYRYESGLAETSDFNEVFIPLFNNAGFTEKFAQDRHMDVQLTSNAPELIADNLPNVFLVTSSPSFYVHQFARRFKIPASNVICSEYAFSEDGKLDRCVRACSSQDKADFVKRMKYRFSVTIGVGDKYELDGAFLNHCDIKILHGSDRYGYLQSSELEAVRKLVNAVRQEDELPDACIEGYNLLINKSRYDKNVFIMTPFEDDDIRYSNLISTIKETLCDLGLNGWTADDLTVNSDLWLNVQCYMHASKYGIAVITADEFSEGKVTTLREDVFNPNVMIETGYMLGQGKDVFLLKDDRVDRVPVDIRGLLHRAINLQGTHQCAKEAVKYWFSDVGSKL